MTSNKRPGPGEALASLARYVLRHKLHSTSGKTSTTKDAAEAHAEIGESDSRALQLAAWLREQRQYDNAHALTYEFAPPEDQQLILSILQQLPEPSKISMLKSVALSSPARSVKSDLTEQADEEFVADSSPADLSTSPLRRKGSYDNLNRAHMYFWSVNGHGESSEMSPNTQANSSIPLALDLALSKAQAAECDAIDIDLRIAKLDHANSCKGFCGSTSCWQRDSFVHIDTLAQVLAAREIGKVHTLVLDFRKSMAKERKAYRLRVAHDAFAPFPQLLHTADAQQWPSKASCPPEAFKGEWRAAHRLSRELETHDSLLEEWSQAFDRVVAKREAVEALLIAFIDQEEKGYDNRRASAHIWNMFSQGSPEASTSKQLDSQENCHPENCSYDELGMFKRESISRSGESFAASASSGSTTEIFHMFAEPEADTPLPLQISKRTNPQLNQHISFQDLPDDQLASSPASLSSDSSSIPTVTPRVGPRLPIDSPSGSPVCCSTKSKSSQALGAAVVAYKTLRSDNSYRPPSPYPRPTSRTESLRLTPLDLQAIKSCTHISIISNFSEVLGSSSIPSLPALSMSSIEEPASRNDGENSDDGSSTITLPGVTEIDLEISRLRRRYGAGGDSWSQ